MDSKTIEEIGAQRLGDLFRLDASLSDADNAVGYWDLVTIRGFVVDQTATTTGATACRSALKSLGIPGKQGAR
ncbi:MAG: hypothetical protein U5N23_06150 [Acidovorax sp.]|nr:hypothetical protein [Acidovorax sp.]MDZ7862360.1 hypothetical protein [Acidovorax sp.]